MFCHKCGTPIAEPAGFCHKCGTKVVTDTEQHSAGESNQAMPPAEPTSAQPSAGNGVSCPQCNSTDLFPVSETETEVSGGGYGFGKGCCGWILLGPLGLLCGLCGTGVKSDSTTRHFWVCKSCGHKFRNAEDARAEADADMQKFILSVLGVSAVLYVAGNLFADQEIRFLGIPAWVYIIIGVIGAVLGFVGAAFVLIGSLIENGTRASAKKISLTGLIASGITFVAGIAFAISGTRFFWIPAWVYIVLGAIACGITAFLLYCLTVSEEKLEMLVTKFEKIAGKFKRK